jgi:hypothetical protein
MPRQFPRQAIEQEDFMPSAGQTRISGLRNPLVARAVNFRRSVHGSRPFDTFVLVLQLTISVETWLAKTDHWRQPVLLTRFSSVEEDSQSGVLSSLRDLSWFVAVNPAMNRWAILFRPSRGWGSAGGRFRGLSRAGMKKSKEKAPKKPNEMASSRKKSGHSGHSGHSGSNFRKV